MVAMELSAHKSLSELALPLHKNIAAKVAFVLLFMAMELQIKVNCLRFITCPSYGTHRSFMFVKIMGKDLPTMPYSFI